MIWREQKNDADVPTAMLVVQPLYSLHHISQRYQFLRREENKSELLWLLLIWIIVWKWNANIVVVKGRLYTVISRLQTTNMLYLPCHLGCC